ncbi:sperm-associated antigen 6-like [Bacillus rossius redtenbacheri]|uniref:sperm-associated antigen 6-like n=1 Tax=Bacillus rossius redtenbacheri TaxID=93214 RepID=UPI002FDEC464
MTPKKILQVFEDYQTARHSFVQNVGKLASRPSNIVLLEGASVLELLQPLLSDVFAPIKAEAINTIGKLATSSQSLSENIVRMNMLPNLLSSLQAGNKYHKTAVLSLVRAVSSYTPETAGAAVQMGALQGVVACLEDFEPNVKTASCWTISNIARHRKDLAEAVVDAGAVPLLVLCSQEPEACLKQGAASALGEIARHAPELARLVVDAGSVGPLARAVCSKDTKLKRHVFAALGNIAKHSPELAEVVVEAGVFPDTLLHLAHTDERVAKSAAVLVSEVAKHSLEMCELLVHLGAIGALIEAVGRSGSDVQMYGIMTLGFMAAHSEQLALAIIESKCVTELSCLLCEDTEDHVMATAVWTLGHIAKHSPRHSQAVADTGAFTKLLQMFLNPKSSEDLKQKCRKTLKLALQKCIDIAALEPLLCNAPVEILKYIVGQLSKVLPNDAKARRLFVATGGLKKIQEIPADPGTTLMEYITIINCCFPEDVVRYFSPGHEESLLDRVEQYEPNVLCVGSQGDGEIEDDTVNSDDTYHEA